MLASFNSQIPTNLRLGHLEHLPSQNAIEFIKLFHDVPVEKTDKDGYSVGFVSLGSIELWWHDPNDDESQQSIVPDYVIHWPIRRPGAPEILLQSINTLTSNLTTMNPEIECLLDLVTSPYVPDYAWVIFGQRKNHVHVHQDMLGTASWNYLIYGHKKWVFWSPKETPTNSNPTCILEQAPGEIVWIPEGWWHDVTYCEASICISKNLVLKRSLECIYREALRSDPHLSKVLDVLSKLTAWR